MDLFCGEINKNGELCKFLELFSHSPLRSPPDFCYTMHPFARKGGALFESRFL